MMRRTMTALVLTVFLSACGDDGMDAGANKTASTATTTPVATPTPTLTARTYTYEKIDIHSDRSFTGYDRLSGTIEAKHYKSFELSSSETGVTSYATADGKLTLPDSADLPNGGVIGTRSTGVDQNGIKLIFSKSNDYDYLAKALYEDRKQFRAFLFGYPTNPTELSGDARTYLALIDEDQNDKLGVESAPLTVDLAKNTIGGTIPRVNQNKNVGLFVITGVVDAARHIAGSLRSKDGQTSGELRGRFFGPGGKEIALLTSFKFNDGTVDQGLLTGKLR